MVVLDCNNILGGYEVILPKGQGVPFDRFACVICLAQPDLIALDYAILSAVRMCIGEIQAKQYDVWCVTRNTVEHYQGELLTQMRVTTCPDNYVSTYGSRSGYHHSEWTIDQLVEIIHTIGNGDNRNIAFMDIIDLKFCPAFTLPATFPRTAGVIKTSHVLLQQSPDRLKLTGTLGNFSRAPVSEFYRHNALFSNVLSGTSFRCGSMSTLTLDTNANAADIGKDIMSDFRIFNKEPIWKIRADHPVLRQFSEEFRDEIYAAGKFYVAAVYNHADNTRAGLTTMGIRIESETCSEVELNEHPIDHRANIVANRLCWYYWFQYHVEFEPVRFCDLWIPRGDISSDEIVSVITYIETCYDSYCGRTINEPLKNYLERIASLGGIFRFHPLENFYRIVQIKQFEFPADLSAPIYEKNTEGIALYRKSGGTHITAYEILSKLDILCVTADLCYVKNHNGVTKRLINVSHTTQLSLYLRQCMIAAKRMQHVIIPIDIDAINLIWHCDRYKALIRWSLDQDQMRISFDSAVASALLVNLSQCTVDINPFMNELKEYVDARGPEFPAFSDAEKQLFKSPESRILLCFLGGLNISHPMIQEEIINCIQEFAMRLPELPECGFTEETAWRHNWDNLREPKDIREYVKQARMRMREFITTELTAIADHLDFWKTVMPLRELLRMCAAHTTVTDEQFIGWLMLGFGFWLLSSGGSDAHSVEYHYYQKWHEYCSHPIWEIDAGERVQYALKIIDSRITGAERNRRRNAVFQTELTRFMENMAAMPTVHFCNAIAGMHVLTVNSREYRVIFTPSHCVHLINTCNKVRTRVRFSPCIPLVGLLRGDNLRVFITGCHNDKPIWNYGNQHWLPEYASLTNSAEIKAIARSEIDTAPIE